MKIGKTIRFFREQLDFMQKELVNTYVEASSISRIEQGKQGIKVDALFEVLDIMSVTREEFFARCQINTSQEDWKGLVYKCVDDPKDDRAKKQLLSYYETIKNKNRTLKELSNYFSIKLYFSRIWTEVDAITEQEIDETFHYLKTKNYYQQYDYTIINNIIMFLTDDQQEYLISKAIPITDEPLRNDEVKKIARVTLINLITSKIYKKDFVSAKNYLHIVEKMKGNTMDYGLTLDIEYLKNLLGYLITGEAVYMKNIYTYISILEFTGDTQILESIKEEVKFLTYKNGSFKNLKNNDFPVRLSRG